MWFRRKADSFDYSVMNACKTCGHEFRGRYCNVCGEGVLEGNEYSVFNFVDSLVSAFTPLEGKFLNSLKLLILKPGQLSSNIAEGIRVPYMKMISLFFLANFFYFLLPLWDSFNSTLSTQMNLVGYHEQATEIVKAKIKKDNIPFADFEKKYNEKSTDLSKLLFIVLPVIFTFAFYMTSLSIRVSMVNGIPKIRIRFPRKFFETMLLSLELYSYHIIFNLMIVSGIALGIVASGLLMGFNWKFLIEDRNLYLIVIATLTYFFSVSQFTFYKQKWYWALPKVLFLMIAFREATTLYRKLLFFVTIDVI